MLTRTRGREGGGGRFRGKGRGVVQEKGRRGGRKVQGEGEKGGWRGVTVGVAACI